VSLANPDQALATFSLDPQTDDVEWRRVNEESAFSAGRMVLRRTDQPGSREALSVRVSHRFTAGSARFDEDNLVSDAGLVPLLGLAE
jgi:hypothetical protein